MKFLEKHVARKHFSQLREELQKNKKIAQQTNTVVCKQTSALLQALSQQKITAMPIASNKKSNISIVQTTELQQLLQHILTSKKKFTNNTTRHPSPLKIMLYHAINNEVQITALAENYQWNFYLPRITNLQKRLMVAAPITSLLKPNPTFKMLEPEASSKEKELHASELNAVILPGLAFDGNGNRLGYGGGFYDRFLASNFISEKKISKKKLPAETYALPLRIGVFNSTQQAEELPANKNDVSMHIAVTEKEILFF